MRTFILVIVVALVVAIGISFAVGLVEIATDHSDGKCAVTITVNTNLIHPISNAVHDNHDSSDSSGRTPDRDY